MHPCVPYNTMHNPYMLLLKWSAACCARCKLITSISTAHSLLLNSQAKILQVVDRKLVHVWNCETWFSLLNPFGFNCASSVCCTLHGNRYIPLTWMQNSLGTNVPVLSETLRGKTKNRVLIVSHFCRKLNTLKSKALVCWKCVATLAYDKVKVLIFLLWGC